MMSTFTKTQNIRWQLLATVSAFALLGSVSAEAADDNPQLWIELGGQLSRLDDGQQVFAPAFTGSPPRPVIFTPSQKFEHLPLYSIDKNGKLSFQPHDSDWVFSASIRYGRSGANRHVHQQTNPKVFSLTYYTSDIYGRHHRTHHKYPKAAKFADTSAQNSESHTILDFTAGKEVGLGLFGNGSSALNLGLRFAQFNSKSNITLKSDPDWHFAYKYFAFLHQSVPLGSNYHSNAASVRARRSFHGLGPTISWNATAPLAGNTESGEIDLDWGVNAALLFGRQRAKVQHQQTVHYHSYKYNFGYNAYPHHLVYQHSTQAPDRSRSVTVPNIGAFAGLSFRYSAAKISLGYRADLFFSAIDGGIDTRKDENRGFYGPFASISVGLGD